MRPALVAALLGAAPAAFACEVPGDGNAPLRELITRVKHHPQTEAWQRMLPDGSVAQFTLVLDAPQKIGGACYWPVEVSAGGVRWKRFLVDANAREVIEAPTRRR